MVPCKCADYLREKKTKLIKSTQKQDTVTKRNKLFPEHLLGWPHLRRFEQILSQVGTGSKQLSLFSVNGVWPQQQVVTRSGVKEQDSQDSEWQILWQLCFPQSNFLLQILLQEYISGTLARQGTSWVFLPQKHAARNQTEPLQRIATKIMLRYIKIN